MKSWNLKTALTLQLRESKHGAEQSLCLGHVGIPRHEANMEQASGAQLA